MGSEGVTIEVVGDKAIIKGDVGSQEALEKIIIAAGNVDGISSVETV
ncbi:MAG: peptidoglycan-binding protein LysM, partial [Alphaproteobacteria bacterium]